MRILSAALLAATLSTPAFANVVPTSLNDCSITSLTGSTSQVIVAANPNRRYLEIFNPNASNPIYVNLAGGTAGTTATSTGTIPVLHTTSVIFNGDVGSSMPINAITVNGTAADAVICYEGR